MGFFSPPFTVLLTSCFPCDWLLQGDVVDADPHLCGPLFQFTSWQFTLTIGWKEAFRIGSWGGRGLGGHRAQLTTLTKPAEGDYVWMEMRCPYCQANDICKVKWNGWRLLYPVMFYGFNRWKRNLPESFAASASWISDTSGAAKKNPQHNYITNIVFSKNSENDLVTS